MRRGIFAGLSVLFAFADCALAQERGFVQMSVDPLATTTYAYSHLWADFDLDGKTDLLMNSWFNPDRSAGELALFKSNGSGAFERVSLPISETYTTICFDTGDVDGDSDPDILVTSVVSFSPDVYQTNILRNDREQGFTKLDVTSTVNLRSSCRLIDMNGDDRADIVGFEFVSNEEKRPAGAISNLDGTFSALSTNITLVAPSYGTTAWGDFTGDGKIDFIVSFEDGSVNRTASYAKFFVGSGTFDFAERSAPFSATGATGVIRPLEADMEGDGDLDLLVQRLSDGYGQGSNPTLVYRNDGSGNFTQVAALSLTGFGPAAWGDYDNDGDLDVALAGRPHGISGVNNRFDLFRQDADGSFDALSLRLPLRTFTHDTTATFVDIDGDGWKDLAYSSPVGTYPFYLALHVFKNSSTYSVSGTIGPPTGLGAEVVAVQVTGNDQTFTVNTERSPIWGTYRVEGLTPGEYTVTPLADYATITPSSSEVTVTNGSIADVDFSATAKLPGVSINGGEDFIRSESVTLHLVPPGAVGTVYVSNDGGFGSYETFAMTPRIPWTLRSNASSKLTRNVYVRFDGGTTYSDDVILDQTVPQVVSASVAGGGSARGAAARASSRRTLKIQAKDNRSGVESMQIKVGRTSLDWQPYKRSAKFGGVGKVQVRVRDGAGNVSKWRTAR